MTTDELWNKFLVNINNRLSLWAYNSVIKDLKIHSYNNSKVSIIVPNSESFLNNLEKNYSNVIEDVINEITNDSCKVEYIYESDVNKLENQNKQTVKHNEIEEDLDNYTYNNNLNPKYTFDTFVVGDSNKLAYCTALEVAKNPGKLYNPYFLYSNSGLGKTHLMHAIGNYIVTHSDKRVLYITAEQFKNDYISIVNTKNSYDNNISYLEAFREKYRNVDVLMIDDIQFLENKEKTQIEFTNTFNSLYDNEKQIIIASDKSVNDIKYLEDRLKTRFRWGLTESIKPPEFELKKNIIKNKIILNNIDLDINEEIINYIANNCGSDIRNIENAVLRLMAYISTYNSQIKELTLDIAKEALIEYVENPVYSPNSISKIVDVVARYYGLDSSMIKGKYKKKNIANARAVAFYLCRMLTEESLERIGLEIGARDHATVLYNYNKVLNDLKTNTNLQEEIRQIKDKLSE